MRYQMLMEDFVFSSWIEQLDYEEDESVIMTLHSGNAYKIFHVPEELYNAWMDAPSHGVFWHEAIILRDDPLTMRIA